LLLAGCDGDKAPAPSFALALRIYWPEQAALDGSWTPPSVVRVA